MAGVNIFDLPKTKGSPERNLLMAIIERALLDLTGNNYEEAEAAREWLFEEVENPHLEPFTFQWICIQLDLDPKKALSKIVSLPRRGSSRSAPWHLRNRLQNIECDKEQHKYLRQAV
ncbi:MAG: hypothetical protein D6808_03430 [Candidatus Dadabacteria bacterium]|nr:MAG: hypothetical protein D6808_03430 [Candidatus Dadabacteria bacterium]